MNLSVVVATKDRPEMLEGCLDAILASISAGDEVIVVDSGSVGPGTREVAEARPVTYVRCDRKGASLARNEGRRAAHHEWCAFIDDDVRVDAGWADALRQATVDFPDVAFFTGRLGLAESDADAERPVAFIVRSEGMEIVPTLEEDVGHGANLSIKRSALERVGGYDEYFGPGAPVHAAEDLELIDRLLAAGYRGRYEPSISATHVQWRQRNDLYGLEWRYGMGQGARLALMFRRNRSQFRAVSHSALWTYGIVEIAKLIKDRYQSAVLRDLLRLTGIALGAVRVTARRPRAVFLGSGELAGGPD